MKRINNTTTTISIFYDQSSWHHLIINFIRPFLNREIESLRLRTYSLYLSNQRGDHLQLILKSGEDKNRLEERISGLLKTFLTNNPSVRIKEQSYPVHGFFMDYYNNSFWFDKYNTIFMSDYHSENIGERISECIIEALGTEEISRDMIYTFMIYMQLGALKAVYPDFEEAAAHMKAMISYLAKPNKLFSDSEKLDNPSEYGQELSHLFENNKHILAEILNDVWSENEYPDEIKWMESWIDICKLTMGQSDFHDYYVAISGNIYHHLGFNIDRYLLTISSELLSNTFEQLVEEADQIKIS